MEQLTTIFAPPASNENGVNCGARTKNGQLSLVNVLHIHFTQTTSTSLDTSGSLTNLINVDMASPLKISLLYLVCTLCCGTAAKTGFSHCEHAEALYTFRSVWCMWALSTVQAISITGPLQTIPLQKHVVGKSTVCTNHIDNWPRQNIPLQSMWYAKSLYVCTAAILITGPLASILGSRQVVARGLLADTLL